MDAYLMKICATAGMASVAAICATVINRFRNVPAGSFAVAGGVVPWFIIATLFFFHSDSRLPALTIVGLFSVGPLFLLAFVFYSFEESSVSRNIAATASMVGMIAGVRLSAVLAYPVFASGASF
ncbi:MAG TPA: hypothetical protein VFG14_00260 [Chthoniobacteraceae bacterium]|nr:hypothetical protein [Chthoniobacteraceae bacterium]